MLTHDRPVGRRSRPGRPAEPLPHVLPPRRRRRADRATSALGLAAGTSAGSLLLLTWVESRGDVDLGLPPHLLTLGWAVPVLLAALALLVPVVATPGSPARGRWYDALLPARRRAVVDLPRPAGEPRRTLPRSRALALAAGVTAVLLLVIALAV